MPNHTVGGLRQRGRNLVEFGQAVMAPFAHHDSIFEEQQSGIAADDGLEGDGIHIVKRILGPRQFAPPRYACLAGGRESDKRIAMFLTVFIDAVDGAEVGIVGLFQMRRHEQESISSATEDAVGDIFSPVKGLHHKIVYGRHIALFDGNGLAVDECPSGVGIILKGKLPLLPVFFQHEHGLKLRRLGPLGYLHPLLDVGAHTVGAEIKRRQIIQAVAAGKQDKQQGVGHHYPLVGKTDETPHLVRGNHEHRGGCQQGHVLVESLPVGERHGITKTPTVADGIVNGKPKCERCQDTHHGKQQAADQASMHGKEQEHAKTKLSSTQQHGSDKGDEVGHIANEMPRLQIVMQLVLCA